MSGFKFSIVAVISLFLFSTLVRSTKFTWKMTAESNTGNIFVHPLLVEMETPSDDLFPPSVKFSPFKGEFSMTNGLVIIRRGEDLIFPTESNGSDCLKRLSKGARNVILGADIMEDGDEVTLVTPANNNFDLITEDIENYTQKELSIKLSDDDLQKILKDTHWMQGVVMREKENSSNFPKSKSLDFN